MRRLTLYLSGMAMGLADLVPGISGGTVAFVLGIYEDLIRSIKAPWTHWKYLLSVVGGIGASLLLFSHFIYSLLQDELAKNLLYSSFFGLVLGSLWFVVRRISNPRPVHGLAFIVAAFFAYLLSGPHLLETVPVQAIAPYRAFFSGMAGISAMLLPGISGSYLFVILGIYPAVIEALSRVSLALVTLSWDGEASFLLLNLGCGIVAGALLFSRVISWLFRKMPDGTVAALAGFMFGALRAVWPFSKEMEMSEGLYSGALIAIAFLIVYSLESVNKKLCQE